MIDMVQQRSRGFGFVTFENGSGGAQKAIESQPINMFGKMVEVKLATPKGDRDGPLPPQNFGGTGVLLRQSGMEGGVRLEGVWKGGLGRHGLG